MLVKVEQVDWQSNVKEVYVNTDHITTIEKVKCLYHIHIGESQTVFVRQKDVLHIVDVMNCKG